VNGFLMPRARSGKIQGIFAGRPCLAPNFRHFSNENSELAKNNFRRKQSGPALCFFCF